MKDNMNRRNLFKLGAAAIVSIPVLRISKLFAEAAPSASTPSVAAPPTEELAWDACPIAIPDEIQKKMAKEKAKTRLVYVADATVSTHKKYDVGAACGNCKFYKTKIENGKLTGEIGGYGKCSMLANKYVSRCGWCKSYKVHKDKLAIYKYVKEEA